MTTHIAPPALRSAEIRRWILGLRDLRRDGLDLAVRGRAGVPSLRSGDRCFAIATGRGRWLVGLADAHGPGEGAAEAARALVAHLRNRAPALARAGASLAGILADANAFVRRTVHCDSAESASDARSLLRTGTVRPTRLAGPLRASPASSGRLVSVVLVHTDATHHAVRIAVAGAVSPLAAGRTGDVVSLGDRGPALGLVDAARWTETGPVRLAPGHVLLAVTDGVPDRARDDGETFGVARVSRVLSEHCRFAPRAVVRSVLDASDAFAPDDPADRTAFALRLR